MDKKMTPEKKTLFVAGRFDDEGGKASKIGKQIFEAVNDPFATYHNGGSFQKLEDIILQVPQHQLLYWFADVSNDKEKLIKDIKSVNPACILVSSKRNIPEKYSFADLVYHALGNKSNLFVEFSEKEGRYFGRVADPLGNVYLNSTSDFTLVGKVTALRAQELLKYTRMSSKQVGEKCVVPAQEDFFETVREYGNKFHELIHASPDASHRFFGNASFRCERGFPSFKEGEKIYVSQRNIDKRSIGPEGFVALNTQLPLEYYGDKKPSVDSPIQVALYAHYPLVRYMLHGHVYVQGAPFTKKIVPCGALEEVQEIINLFPDPQTVNVAVNLKGHGSLLMVNRVQELQNTSYYPRPTPEVHLEYESLR